MEAPGTVESLVNCKLKIEGRHGCNKPGCACGNEPYIMIWLITPGDDVHGAAIQSFAQANELIFKLREFRDTLWRKGK